MAKCQFCDSGNVVETVLAGESSTFTPPKEYEAVVCRKCGRTSVGEAKQGGIW